MNIKQKIAKFVFSFNGLSIVLGIMGSLFGLLAFFIDLSEKVSIKWLVFLLMILLFVTITLLKVLSDTNNELEMALTPKIKVTSILLDQGLVIAEYNKSFIINTIVSLYMIKDDCEIFVASAYVYHIQENLIQIKLNSFDSYFTQQYAEDYNMIAAGNTHITKDLIIKNIVKHNSL